MERTLASTLVKHLCQNPCQLHHEEQLDWQVQLDHPDHMDLQDLQDLKEPQDLKDPWDYLVNPDCLELLELMD